MKQHGIGIGRFVGVVLIPQFVAGMVGLKEHVQLSPQNFHLLVGQHAHTRQVAFLAIKRDLLGR